jgi:endoplasmic reticulum Man9GlcNAc2 1,2-alpha-mannosidase
MHGNGMLTNSIGYDEYHPDTKSGRQMVPPTGLGWIIVDALDTLMLMNLTNQLAHARDWVRTTLDYRLDHDVNTFETTIRMLGGFLSAHYLQGAYPDLCPLPKGDKDGEDLYLEKAVELAERLVAAYESPTGIPYASVNLKTMEGIESHSDGGSSSLSEATTTQLEMKYLSNLTGEAGYWEKAEAAMVAVDDPDSQSEPDGLKGIFISPKTGKFTSHYVRLGSRGDSYYEYLIKQYLQTSNREPVYLEMWNEALEGIKKHLITYSAHTSFTVLAERPYGVHGKIEPKMDHLVCFLPGTLALSVTEGKTVAEVKKAGKWTEQKQEDLELAEELLKTCWAMYKYTKTGLAGEITFFHLPADEDPKMYYDFATVKDKSKKPRPKSPDLKDVSEDADWRQDVMLKSTDSHNLQRPETVESLFVLWRLTGDEKYRDWGWEMFQSFMKHTIAPEPDAGFTSIVDVNAIPTKSRNNMESFWLVSKLCQLHNRSANIS